MSNGTSVYTGDIASLAGIDVDGPIAKAKEPCCEDYSTQFQIAAVQAEQRADTTSANAYKFLQVIVSFAETFDTPDQPFSAFVQWEDRRSGIPADLSTSDIEAMRQLLKQTNDPALRARLCDVIWELTKDYKACEEATRSYISSAERLNTDENWRYSATAYKRALALGAKLGRNKEPYAKVTESLLNAARTAANDTGALRCCRMMELLIQCRMGEAPEFAPIAAAFAIRAQEAGNMWDARLYREVEANWHKLAKNSEAEKAARLAAAETYVADAEKRATGENASAMAAASLLTSGIEALRRAGAEPSRIEELRKRLAKYQGESHKEMKTISTPFDVSEPSKMAREHVKAPILRDALFKFTLGRSLSDPNEVRTKVLDMSKQFIVTYLFGTSLIDGKGRTVAKKEGLHGLKGEELEEQIEAEMFHHVAQFDWHFRVAAYINPARLQILNDHHPTFQDLLFVVRDNPFVPPGHEGIFLRGIHAGFHGDFLVASHLLVPQIENSMRHVLELNGVDVSILQPDGIQPLKMLGGIFAFPQTKEIFGESQIFELRGHLIQKTGYDFRNVIAHGFVSEENCYSNAALGIWWLVLRICLTPVYSALTKQGAVKADQPGEQPA